MLLYSHKPYGFLYYANRKLSKSQNQGRIFEHHLEAQLNPKNKLYKLRFLINWSDLEEKSLAHVDIKQFARDRKPHRVMLGLLMLQAMYNGTDSFTEEELTENMYWLCSDNCSSSFNFCNPCSRLRQFYKTFKISKRC